MRKNYLTAAIILTVCFLGGCASENMSAAAVPMQSKTAEHESSAAEEKPAIEDVAVDKEMTKDSYAALNKFSYELFGENMDEDNPVLSPVSAYIALSMAGMGAENNTREEFASVLGDYTDITAICGNMMTTLPTASKNNTVTLANSAWIDDEFAVRDSWLAYIENIMRSEAFQANLSAMDTVGDMNEWISDKTNGLIDKMIEEPFNGDTRLVLFNTIYFKAKWENRFEAHTVFEDKFYLEDGNEINAELMHKEDDMEYISNDFAEGIIFPYMRNEEGDGNFAFVALRPIDENMKVRDMYGRLNGSVISELISSKQTKLVNTKLPKFEIEFDRELNESLIKMGLKDAFDAGCADFSGIGENRLTDIDNNLYINLVRQKAKIIVDEDGTEAAAVTAIMMECGAAIMEDIPKEVFFDRPFAYMIMDMDREAPLFIGILDSPAVCHKLP